MANLDEYFKKLEEVSEQMLTQDKSMRTTDAQGFLHVEMSNISKANVCPYRGNEIPDWESLGLDAHKIYQMLRPADELKKAASTFNMLPLMDKHIPVSAFNLDDPEIKSHLVGTTGDSAQFQGQYLTNRLVIHQKSAIENIVNHSQRELSCGYRYTPDMTPGTFDGIRYDGKMTDIIGNHVALVDEGRAGPDVMVEDGKLKVKRISSLKQAFDFNPNHDDKGLFSDSEGSGAGGKYVPNAALKAKNERIAQAASSHESCLTPKEVTANSTDKISEKEHEAMTTYSGKSYQQINTELRGNRTAKVQPEIVQSMDKVFEKVSLKEDKTVYRGITSGGIRNMFGADGPKVGDSIMDRAFVSTTENIKLAEGFGKRDGGRAYVIQIDLPKGSKAYDFNDHGTSQYRNEKEILLPRGSQFKVESVKTPSHPMKPIIIKVSHV